MSEFWCVWCFGSLGLGLRIGLFVFASQELNLWVWVSRFLSVWFSGFDLVVWVSGFGPLSLCLSGFWYRDVFLGLGVLVCVSGFGLLDFGVWVWV